MATHYEQVLEFYKTFSQRLPALGSEPSLTNEVIGDRIDLKMDLIFEEFQELVEAVYGKAAGACLKEPWAQAKAADDGTRDVVEAADALADLDYVLNGMAIEANIPLDEVFEHVHASNMSKLDDEGQPVISDGITPDPRDGKVKPKGKILKSSNFWEPSIGKILFR